MSRSFFDELIERVKGIDNETVDDDAIRNYIETYLYVRPKKGTSLVPLRFNEIQNWYWPRRTNADYILKYRQGGFSTITMAEYFARCCLVPNETVVILAHRAESTERLFSVVRLFYDRLPESEKVRINGGRKTAQVESKRELYFAGMNSRFLVSTAGSPDAARGLTLTSIHASEFAFWSTDIAEDAISALLGALVPDGRIRIETTPNVAASYAYEEWRRAMAGESMFHPVFLAWWDDPRNRASEPVDPDSLTQDELDLVQKKGLDLYQIGWRRRMILQQKAKFFREYPEDPEQCWQHSGSTVFNLDRVKSVWASDAPDPTAVTSELLAPGERWLVSYEDCLKRLESGRKFVIGADPAGGGEEGDFSAIQMLDAMNGEQVYAAHVRVPVYQFATVLNELGRTFGNALMVVERNNHGQAVLQRLLYDLEYPNLFYDYIHVRSDDKAGILTNQAVKAQLIATLEHAFWEQSIVLRDPATYDQLRTYVYDDNQKAGATPGTHDDLVSALMCAVYGLVQQGAVTAPRATTVTIPGAAPKSVPETVSPEVFAKSQVWFKVGAGGRMLALPFIPEFTAPSRVAPNKVQDLMWSCPSCGSTRVMDYGVAARCAVCGIQVDRNEITRKRLLTRFARGG